MRECNAGTYQSAKGQGSCSACVSGSYCIQGSTSLTFCDDGYFSNPYTKSASDCFPCSAGSYCKNGAQIPCSSGKYQSLQGQISCNTCPIASFCVQETVNPTPCPSGKYSTSSGGTSLSSCITCTAGTYQSQSGQSYCLGCSPGYYCYEGALTPCPGGSFSSAVNATSVITCQLCKEGYWGNEHSTQDCTEICPEGYYCTLAVKKVCGGGYYCSGGKKTACSRGKYSISLTASIESTCIPCGSSTGFYSQLAASSASMCKSASCATTGYQGDDGYCQCAVGYFGNVTYTYQDQSGFVSIYPAGCTACGRGNYCPNAFTRISCAPGKFSSSLTAIDISTCTKCPSGTYSTSYAASSPDACKSCSLGNWSNYDCTGCIPIPCASNDGMYVGDAGKCKCSAGI